MGCFCSWGSVPVLAGSGWLACGRGKGERQILFPWRFFLGRQCVCKLASE